MATMRGRILRELRSLRRMRTDQLWIVDMRDRLYAIRISLTQIMYLRMLDVSRALGTC